MKPCIYTIAILLLSFLPLRPELLAYADGLPSDPSKPSFQLYQSDLVIDHIKSGKATYKDAQTAGLKLQKYFSDHPNLEQENKAAYDALRKKEIELARAYGVGCALGDCKSKRDLDERIYKNVLNQEVSERTCTAAPQGTAFSAITSFVVPTMKLLNKAKVQSENDKNATRPELIEEKKQVYLEGLTNGIKNQLEIGFHLDGYPHTQEMVDRVINNLVDQRCTLSTYCTTNDKNQMRADAQKYAKKSGFAMGSPISDQSLIDQFCTQLNSYPQVKLFYQNQKDEQNEPTYAQKMRDPNYYNRPKQDGILAAIPAHLKQQAAAGLSVGYRQAAVDMMHKGGVGLLLMGGKSGAEFLGPPNCQNPQDPKNLTYLKTSRSNLRAGLDEHAKRLADLADPKVKSDKLVKDQLAKMITANPGAFAEVVGKHPDLAAATCDVINDVEKQDIRQEHVDTALMIGGMVVAGALVATGVGAAFVGAGAAILGSAVTVGAVATAAGWGGAVVAGVSMTNNIHKYYQYDDEAKLQMDAVKSSNGTEYGNADERTYSEAKTNEEKKAKAKSDAIKDGVTMVMSPIGGKIVSSMKEMKAANQAKNVVSEGVVIEDEANVAVNASKTTQFGKISNTMGTYGKNISSEVSELGDRLGVSAQDVVQYTSDCVAAPKPEECVMAIIKGHAQKHVMKGIGALAGKSKNSLETEQTNGNRTISSEPSEAKTTFGQTEKSKEYFDFDQKIKTAKTPEELNLFKAQKAAFEDFKSQSEFNKLTPEQQKDVLNDLYAVHSTGETKLNGKPSKEKVLALNQLKAKLKNDLMERDPNLSSAEAKQKAFAMIDGISNKDVHILGTSVSELMAAPIKDVNVLNKIQDPKTFEKELNEELSTRNHLFKAYNEETNQVEKMKIYKVMKKHDEAVKDLSYIAGKKLGIKPAEVDAMFAKPTIVKTETPSTAQTTKAETPPTKTIDESLSTIKEYKTKFDGTSMAKETNDLHIAPDSSAKKIIIDQKIQEQQDALDDLKTIKETHGNNFKSLNSKEALDANAEITKREVQLNQNLARLKAEQSSLKTTIDITNKRLTELNTYSEFRSDALNQKLSNGIKPTDPFITKVKDELKDLETIKKNFPNKDDLPALNKVDLDAEIKRMNEFLKNVQFPQ